MQKILLQNRSFFVCCIEISNKAARLQDQLNNCSTALELFGFWCLTQGHVTGWGFNAIGVLFLMWNMNFQSLSDLFVSFQFLNVSQEAHIQYFFFFFFFLQPNCYDVMCRMWCAFGMCVSQESQWHTHWEKSKKQLTGAALQFSTLVVMVMWCICVCEYECAPECESVFVKQSVKTGWH